MTNERTHTRESDVVWLLAYVSHNDLSDPLIVVRRTKNELAAWAREEAQACADEDEGQLSEGAAFWGHVALTTEKWDVATSRSGELVVPDGYGDYVLVRSVGLAQPERRTDVVEQTNPTVAELECHLRNDAEFEVVEGKVRFTCPVLAVAQTKGYLDEHPAGADRGGYVPWSWFATSDAGEVAYVYCPEFGWEREE